MAKDVEEFTGVVRTRIAGISTLSRGVLVDWSHASDINVESPADSIARISEGALENAVLGWTAGEHYGSDK